MSTEAMVKEDKKILGISYDLIDYETVWNTIDEWRRSGKQGFVTLTPALSLMLCREDKELHRATVKAQLTLPDSAGVILAAKLFGYKHCGRVAGPTLMLKCCDWGQAHGYRHYFYGGAPGVANKLVERLSDAYPRLQVAGIFCPPYRQLSEKEDKKVIEIVNTTRPDIVWVGLGTPKQEKWMANHFGLIKATAMIGVGAAFDFHSGNVKWAPSWVRTIGLEWAYRLICEPRRWRRYCNIPFFILAVVSERFTKSTIVKRSTIE